MPKPRKPKPEGEKESRMGKTLDPFEEYFISPSPGPSSRPQQSRQPPGPLPQSECTDEQCYSDGQQGTNDKAYKQLKEIGDIVVQYDPVHAVLPWAGVRFIPMVCDPPALHNQTACPAQLLCTIVLKLPP